MRRFSLRFARLALALVAVAVLLPVSGLAEEDDAALITRFFDISALTEGQPEFIRGTLRLIGPDMVSDEENPLFGAEGEEPRLPVGSIDELTELVMMQVDPVFWQITDGGGVHTVGQRTLVVQATREVVDHVAAFLSDLEADVLTPVTVEIVAVDASGVEPGASAEQILRGGRRGPSLVMTSYLGQRATGSSGTQASYAQDYDVEVAQDSAIADPIIGIMNTGMAVAVRSLVGTDPDRIRLQLDAQLALLKGMRTQEASKKQIIEMPDVAFVESRTDFHLRPGMWTVAEGRSFGADGHWLFLVRAAMSRTRARGGAAPVIFEPSARADGGPLVSRMFDIADLAEAPVARVGRQMDLVPSNFCPPEPPELPEPAPIFGQDPMGDLLPMLVTPSSWNRDGAGLQIWNQKLIVSNTEKVLTRVEKTLADLRRFFIWNAAIDVQVLALPPGVASEIVAPRQDGSGYLIDESERALLAEVLADPQAAEVLDRVRVVSLAGVRRALSSAREIHYAQDFEVEIAEKSAIPNPVIQLARSGLTVDLHPSLTVRGDAISLTARITRTRLHEPMRELVTPHGVLDAPVIDMLRFRTSLKIPLGRTGVIGAGSQNGRTLVVLATPTVDRVE